MQPSMFNVQVPLAERNEVFLMNTLLRRAAARVAAT